jgi:hypothetical protein
MVMYKIGVKSNALRFVNSAFSSRGVLYYSRRDSKAGFYNYK